MAMPGEDASAKAPPFLRDDGHAGCRGAGPVGAAPSAFGIPFVRDHAVGGRHVQPVTGEIAVHGGSHVAYVALEEA